MKKAFLLFPVFLSLVAGRICAQPTIINKSDDELKLFNAGQAYNAGIYVKAINLYREVQKNKPNDPSIMSHIGDCYFNMNETDDAISTYEKAKSINPTVNNTLRFMLGQCYQMKGRLDEAIAEFTAALAANAGNAQMTKDINHYLDQCHTAQSLMATPKPVKVSNLGAGVNSPYDDKRPSITADGKTLVFTSRRPDGKNANRDVEGDGGYFEDIYESAWDSTKGAWGDARLAPGSVNTAGHDAACSISPDGKYLFVYVNNPDDGGAGDIAMSKRSSSGKWGSPKNMGKGINTSYFEDGAVLSPDGNTLYFMSERGQDLPWKGQKGYGHSDIWMCKKKGRNEWSDPINLGPKINTEYDEGGINPAPDGKTLYFCSNGHNSMGGYDIFMTRYENGDWTEPVNLGYPINTIGNERMFLLSKDGKTAYIDSDRDGGLGGRDIWVVDMTNLLPKPHTGPYMSLLTGTIFDGNGQPVTADLKVYDSNGTVVKTVTSSKQGNYQVELEGDKTYEIRIEMPGYKKVDEKVKLDADKDGSEFELVKHFLLYKE